MSQSEILEYLATLRAGGDDDYIAFSKLVGAFSIDRKMVYKQVKQLYLYGYLEAKEIPCVGMFSRSMSQFKAFRIKKVYINKFKRVSEPLPPIGTGRHD